MKLRRLIRFWIRLFALSVFGIASVLVAQQPVVDLMRQADAAYRAGEPDRAATLFRQVLRLDPSAAPAHMFLGIITSQSGQWREAIEHFQVVVEATPANAHAHFFLGAAYGAEGKWAEAAQSYSLALKNQFPERDRLIVELARAQIESGQPKQALTTLRSIEAPSDKQLASQYHAVQALAQQRLDQPTQAIESIRRALENNGYDPGHWQFLISSILSSGQVEIAMAEALTANRRFPNHSDIQYQFGVAGYFVPELPFTEMALRNMRETRPDDPRVSVLEGLVSDQRGRLEQASEAFRAAAALGIPEAHLFLGLALQEQGDQAAAESELREALRHLPHNGQVLFGLGKVLSAGNPEEALGYMRKAEVYMPMNPTLHYGLGTLYRRLEQPDKAAHHMELFRKYQQEEARLMER
ncbi:MAG: tetratricopeptide repeat protein [Acidobacteria bacterium]|nr:tetratricopeptide repeat protein [Acidobacteriota bacterium]